MHYVRLYGRYISVYLKSLLEYRVAFFSDMAVLILAYVTEYFAMWVILNKFNNIMGWGFYEILFLYTLNLISYALSGMFFKHPMLDLQGMVLKGEFDFILTKPVNTLFNVVARQFQEGFLAHTALSIVVFALCFNKLGIHWSAPNIGWFALFVLGGTLIQAALMIVGGCCSFFFLNSTGVVETTIYGFRRFIFYPITVYPALIQFILTFIIPYAFVNFYPAQFFLNKSGGTLFGPWLQFGAPVVGVVMFALAVLLWNFSINHYQSTGS